MFHLDVKWQVCCTGDMLFCIRWCLPQLFHNEAPSTSSTFCWHAEAGRFSSPCEGAECTCWKCFVLSPDGTFERGLVRTSQPGCIVFLPWCRKNSLSNQDRLTFIMLRGTCQKPNHLWLQKALIYQLCTDVSENLTLQFSCLQLWKYNAVDVEVHKCYQIPEP